MMTTDAAWLARGIMALTTDVERLTPSQWAERTRFLPRSASPHPGYFSWEVTPYFREPLDCLGPDSPVREVVIQKGAQVGATVAILENLIGYLIGHVKTAPVMLLSADADMAKTRLGQYVLPMISFCGLDGNIRSADEANARKTGRTDARLEWTGGGFLVPYGAVNANKLRSLSIQYLLRDEIDGYPETVGKDGDPLKLSANRTAAFSGSRKILDLSTPTVRGQSQIEDRFKLGDQRYYYVRCLRCGEAQKLRWKRTNPDTGEVTGIVFDNDHGRLVPGTTRYLCRFCGFAHRNEDKARLLSPEWGAEWRPTAVPIDPAIRSYHLSALYSPPKMRGWEDCARDWLQAWDVERDCVRDMKAYRDFQNNVFGATFELRGEKLRFEQVSPHRRHAYKYGTVPNRWALQFCGSRVLATFRVVDVHGDNLAVAVFGWCRDRRAVLISYERFDGDTSQLDNPGTWGRLWRAIESERFAADDGLFYTPVATLIDIGFSAEIVGRFIAGCTVTDQSGALQTLPVFGVKGQGAGTEKVAREFQEAKTASGERSFLCRVDHYKDRWSAALARPWDGVSQQPSPYFNAPIDATDAQLKELTVEVKREKIDRKTNRHVGWEWHRPGNARNELWDLLIYADCALDVFAHEWSKERQLPATNWAAFYDYLIAVTT